MGFWYVYGAFIIFYGSSSSCNDELILHEFAFVVPRVLRHHPSDVNKSPKFTLHVNTNNCVYNK